MIAFALSSCDLTEVNIDPTSPNGDQVSLNLVLPAALSQAAYNQSALTARLSGILMQQFEGFDAQQNQYTIYVIGEADLNNYWNTGLYAGVLKDCDVMIQKAQALNLPHYEAIAKILMADAFATGASFFGEIPYSEALKGNENLRPAYDTQEAVYTAAQGLLDQAIELLAQPAGTGDVDVAGGDIVYGGDPAAWTAVAKSLKARYFMHLSRRDPQAATKALGVLSGAIGSLDEQPNFAWESALTSANPLYLFGFQRPNTLVIADQFETLMNDRNDPRKSKYMVDNNGWKYFQSGNADLVWAQSTSAVPLISYVEVKFLEAEALHRTGAAGVQAALTDAVTASMEQVGLNPADSAVAAYIAARCDLSALSGNQVLERIMEEAYSAYYGYAFQQIWTNYRRTGYPALTPNASGANGLNPSGVIPRRFIYPIDEKSTNRANVEAAIGRQGPDLLDTETWAFKP